MKQKHAIEELVHTDRPVAEIGEALGYQSPASFTRAFKSWTGQSPREYRRRPSQETIAGDNFEEDISRVFHYHIV